MADSDLAPVHSPTPLHQLSFVLQQIADDLLMAKLGVGLSHARIMGVLRKDSTKSQRVIAIQLRQTEANVSRQLQVMKDDGLVSITKNKKDGRQRDIKLTAKGSHKKEQAEKLLADQQAELLKLLVGSSADVKEFIQMTERLLTAFSAETRRNQKIFGTD
jgi:DNA-binding MarR family transcriptional regulator